MGLKNHLKSIFNNTATVTVNDYDGLRPLYCVERADGTLDIVPGSYADPMIKKKKYRYTMNDEGQFITDEKGNRFPEPSLDKDGNQEYIMKKNEETGENEFVYETPVAADFVDAEPIPPKCGKDESLTLCTLTLRNPDSPDAKNFAKENGFDPDKFRRSYEHLYLTPEKDLSDEDIKILEEDVMYRKEKERMITAGYVVSINNIPSDEGEQNYIPYSKDNIIKLLTDLPLMVPTIKARVADRKKFMNHS